MSFWSKQSGNYFPSEFFFAFIDLTSFFYFFFSSRNDEIESVSRLADFSADFVLESVAKMLNVIYEPEITLFENVRPPVSMSARYKRGAELAENCKKLGFSESSADLGYHTFLYSNEKDLRAVYMFLMDKLPKDNVVTAPDLGDFKLHKPVQTCLDLFKLKLILVWTYQGVLKLVLAFSNLSILVHAHSLFELNLFKFGLIKLNFFFIFQIHRSWRKWRFKSR